MFNIVKRQDFMLGSDVPTKQEADQIAHDYGKEYVAVETDRVEQVPADTGPRRLSL